MNPQKSTPSPSLTLDDMMAFVQNQLSPEEHERVEALVKDNPLYAEAIDSIRESIDDPAAILEIRDQEEQFDRKLHSLAREIHRTPAPVNLLQRTWESLKEFLNPANFRRYPALQLPLAGMVIALGVWLWLANQSLSYPQLASDYAAHFVDRSLELSTMEDEAIELYRQQRYKEAIPILQELLSKDQAAQNQNMYRMFLGVSLLKEKQPDLAEEQFLQLVADQNNTYTTPARWYLALSLLAQSKASEAQEQLRWLETHVGIDQESKEYSRLASELLEKMAEVAED